MSRSLYVPLPTDAREALIDLAIREYRDPREQAAYFVVEGLKRAGVLPAEQTDHRADQTAVTA